MKSPRLALGLLGLAIAGLWYCAGGSQPLPRLRAAEDGSQITGPRTHENLSVYFIHGDDAVRDAKVLTLQEALERNLAIVHETGCVNTLAVENRSADHELFIQSGDIVKGGKQDRMAQSDMLLPPMSGIVSLPTHCVEQGRWTARESEDAKQFKSSSLCAVGRKMKLANASGQQGEVWKTVADNQGKLNATLGAKVNAGASPTSFQLSLEAPALQAQVAEYEAGLKAACEEPSDIIGAVFVVNGQVTGAEVYGSNVLFRKAWPKLLNSAAVEAVAERTDRVASAQQSVREIERYLVRAADPEAASQVANAPRGSLSLGNFTATEGRTGQFVVGERVNSDAGLNGAIRLTRPVEAVSINFDKTQWDEVLDWYAMKTGLTLITTVRPTGSLTLKPSDDRKFTMSEVTDLLNEALSQQKFILIRRHMTFFIQPTDETIDPTLLPRPVLPVPPVNSAGNRLQNSRVESSANLVVESRDPNRKNAVIHKSYIKK